MLEKSRLNARKKKSLKCEKKKSQKCGKEIRFNVEKKSLKCRENCLNAGRKLLECAENENAVSKTHIRLEMKIVRSGQAKN